MRIPSDQIHGSPSFHTLVQRRPDGTYEARNTSMPEVPAQTAPTESEAIRLVNQATEAWIGSGCREVGEA